MSPRSHRIAVIRHAAVACAFAFVASVLPAAEVELNDSVGGAVTEDEGTSEDIVRLASYR